MDSLNDILEDKIWLADDPWRVEPLVRREKSTLYSIGSVTPIPMQRVQSRLYNLKSEYNQ